MRTVMSALLFGKDTLKKSWADVGHLAKTLSFAGLLLLILLYYFSMAFRGYTRPPPPIENHWGWTTDGSLAPAPTHSYYALLSESLLQGKLHFLDEPPQQLTELKDPYDPDANFKFRRYHDACYYKGNWYIYFGITPALLLGIPARLLGFSLRDDVAVPILFWLGLLFSLGLLRAIVRLGDLKPRFWMWVMATVCLALCSAQPFVAARCQVYEVAVASSFFCFFAALYLLFTGFFFDRIVPWRLALGSLFMALAVGSRPNAILHGWIVLVLAIRLYRKRAQLSQEQYVIYQVALCAPYVVMGYCLGLYNYLRFDSWTNFGFRYVLAGFDVRLLPMFQFNFIPPNLWFYFFQPLELNAIFPFFHWQSSYPAIVPPFYCRVPGGGILCIAPILLILAWFPLSVRSIFKENSGVRQQTVLWLIGALLLSSLLQVLFLTSALPYATMRYMIDFAPALVFAAVIMWFYLHAQQPLWGRFLALGVTIAIGVGCAENIALGMAGEDDYFRRFNPAGYQAVRQHFEFIERLAGAKPK